MPTERSGEVRAVGGGFSPAPSNHEGRSPTGDTQDSRVYAMWLHVRQG